MTRAAPPAPVELEADRFTGLNEIESGVARQIIAAIAERRLMPGTRLTEEEMSRLLGVSRERIRRVLLVLSQHGILDIAPNRGAFVAVPTPAQRREAFELRQLLERHIVTALCARPPAERRQMAAALHAHVQEEQAAGTARDRALQIRLSGDFHLKLAALHGNAQMLRTLRETMRRMSLALAAQPPLQADLDCSINEHLPLVEAIERGDAAQAAQLMDGHLAHVEQHLVEPGRGDDSPLARAFKPAR
ncbi:GntR family transcriptional regulator [Caldimonas thermodepolymerans]|jgi:Transcriptional regulators|uniref:GntR family transcriptional regulator n=1 Tax=Caldimonas thermodepolymerans TaxID=215580 RepID=A0A2S5T4K4_9BURK|nr:GntR family transcriptional regulator [Caldimonas thermodepolymerans]PPE69924.1 GntR family transcriptional regulator [Caldimonas thermodepolymerans]QPC31656.1 GntR family transcriptional regulator [Caldimonas thermodepolymerans]RDH94851.1 DNA-binding GntR family transcriptional regulator [Caldimonas thermodepolymerans]TCP02758.1 DNA-binding GntR family transcriptional regulator [Caldimonas thermodepolymerans]UZG44437.1 GntR family transcriptional regulator [Caldimonas thermodepolymerans]